MRFRPLRVASVPAPQQASPATPGVCGGDHGHHRLSSALHSGLAPPAATRSAPCGPAGSDPRARLPARPSRRPSRTGRSSLDALSLAGAGPLQQRVRARFFRNTIGSGVADNILTLGATASAAGVNLPEYFATLLRNRADVRAHPEDWLP